MKFFSKFSSDARRNKQQKNYQKEHHSHRQVYLLNKDTPFSVTEAFRNLKASLSVAVPKKENDGAVSLLVTSNYPEEGKTTVAVNLALMFAMSNVKVVLVDADMRKGRVAKYFKEHHEPGLSEYLSGQAKFEDILHRSKENENLYVIYQGTNSPRPYELLESDATKAFSEKLKEEFDYVIFDTPPVKIVSDALAVVPFTDGALLVCRHMSTYESDIKASIDSLKFAKANVLGIVVNDFHVNPKKMKKNQKKYYYSYYSYNEDPENAKKSEIAPPPQYYK